MESRNLCSRPPRRLGRWVLLLGLGGGAVSACEQEPAVKAPAKVVEPEPDVVTGPPVPLASKTGRVRFKGGERYATDLATALGLPRDQLCRELGVQDCVDQTHRVVLGGVEPYDLGIYNPLSVAPMTAPIAADRIALAACGAAARRDVTKPADAVFFAGLQPLAGLTDAQRRQVAERLYDRLLLRDAEAFEVDALVGLHGDVAAELAAANTTTTAAGGADEQWLTLSCFAVATSLEALFY